MRIRGALLALAIAVAACAPAPSPSAGPTRSPDPATASASPGAPTASPSLSPGASSMVSPTPVVIAGDVRLAVTGHVKAWCDQDFIGCTYWVTLFVPGVDAYRARLDLGSDRSTLTLGPGLPAKLSAGRYALVFEVGVVSDVVSFAPDGTEAIDIRLMVACTERLDIGDQFKTTATVVFDGIGCTVQIREGST